MKLKTYSDLMEAPIDIGPEHQSFDEILELGTTLATSRPGLIVFVENPPLQKWEPDSADD
jgi:hypothetical protein